MTSTPEMPVGITTTTLTGRFIAPDGTRVAGRLYLTPPDVLTLPGENTIVTTPALITLVDGEFTVALVPNDVPGMAPFGWTYKVTEKLEGVPPRVYHIMLPTSPSPVDLAGLRPVSPYAGNYLPVAGPKGDKGDPGDSGLPEIQAHEADTTDVHGIADTALLETQSGAQAKADAAATAAEQMAAADTTAQITAHVQAADPHGDRADAAAKYVPLTDTRLTDSRAPSGAAGGALTGTYPDPDLSSATVASFDAAGAASAAQSAAEADATAKVSAHVAAPDPHGDRADAAAPDVALTDGRLTDARTPAGPAGGDLTGSYPNPTLSATAVAGFDPAGAADAAQAAAETAAATDAANKVSAHVAAVDPHGDRAYADATFVPLTDGRLADARTPTGSAGGALTGTYPDPDLSAATIAAFDAAGSASAAQTAAEAAAATDATNKISAHVAAVDPHGDRADAASKYVPLSDARLSDARTPTAHAASHGDAGSDPVTLGQDQITGLVAALAALLPLAGGTLTGDLILDGHNLTVERADGTGAYRLRVTGGGLDFEVGGMDVVVSVWSAADMTGTQSSVMRWEPAGTHLVGRTQFGTSPYDDVHDIDATTGVASLGAKNGLVNLRFCGRQGSAGAPVAGTWTAGDLVLDAAGVWFLCTADGTPGTWVSASGGGGGPAAATAVTSETTFGQTATVGTSTDFARGDHTHGTPDLTVGTTAGTVAAGDDSRFTDARTPLAHAASHATGAGDPVSPSSIGAYSAADGNTLNGYVTDLQNRVGGEFGLENRTTALENTRLINTNNLSDVSSVATARANLLAGYGNVWGPPDHGFLAWGFDPSNSTGSGTSLSAGYIYMIGIQLRQAATISKLHICVGTAGSGLTANQCLAGLYDASGNRVGVTGDMSTVWNSVGSKAMNLTASYAAAAGRYYVALVFNGTTSPVITCGSTQGATFTPGNANLSSGAYRFCRQGPSNTALAATVTLASYTPDANNIWTAVS